MTHTQLFLWQKLISQAADNGLVFCIYLKAKSMLVNFV